MAETKQMSFLQHLDELRWRLVRVAIAVILVGIVIWIFQEWIMNHLFLSLKSKDFVTFKLMCRFLGVCVEDTPVKMQSMTMSGQFNYAMTMCIMGGLIVASPYIFYQIWAFVRPGLKQNELKAAKGLVFYCKPLFYMWNSFWIFCCGTPYSSVFSHPSKSAHLSKTISRLVPTWVR